MTEAVTTDDQSLLPPGPYIVTGPNGYLNQIGIGRDAGPNDYVDPIGVAYGAGKQVEAIANLFAAAPDLLKALKLLRTPKCPQCNTYSGLAYPSDCDSEFHRAKEISDKAIAKAEGRSNG